jgi:hypothetical protein
MSDRPTYRQALNAVRRAGMSVSDGLGFTIGGGQLVNGEDASEHIQAMNGWPVEDIARAIAARTTEKG